MAGTVSYADTGERYLPSIDQSAGEPDALGYPVSGEGKRHGIAQVIYRQILSVLGVKNAVY